MWSSSCVNTHVSGQCGFFNTHLVTLSSMVRFVIRMLILCVFVQSSMIGKFTLTYVALVIFYTRVSIFMVYQTCLILKGFYADISLKWAVIAMRPHMPLKSSLDQMLKATLDTFMIQICIKTNFIHNCIFSFIRNELVGIRK